LERKKSAHEAEQDSETGPGVLFSSGLIAGGAIAGILLALTQVLEGVATKMDFSQAMGSLGASDLFSLIVFMAMAGVLFFIGKKKPL
jgi:hypothetical protein